MRNLDEIIKSENAHIGIISEYSRLPRDTNKDGLRLISIEDIINVVRKLDMDVYRESEVDVKKVCEILGKIDDKKAKDKVYGNIGGKLRQIVDDGKYVDDKNTALENIIETLKTKEIRVYYSEDIEYVMMDDEFTEILKRDNNREISDGVYIVALPMHNEVLIGVLNRDNKGDVSVVMQRSKWRGMRLLGVYARKKNGEKSEISKNEKQNEYIVRVVTEYSLAIIEAVQAGKNERFSISEAGVE